MTVNSDWQELRELSEEKRQDLVKEEAMNLANLSTYILSKADICLEVDIAVAQQHLDRIKALVMSRPCNQEK